MPRICWCGLNKDQAELLQQLYAACPGYVPDDSREGLAYPEIAGYVRHVIAAHVADRKDEVQAAFDIIEATIAADDRAKIKGKAAELAVIGFLEDMQNGNLHKDGTTPSDFSRYLGPSSKKSWDALNGFWEMVENSKGGK